MNDGNRILGSQEACVLPQVGEWTLLGWGRVSERGLSKFAAIPELEPLEVLWSLFDVILVAVLLKEKLCIAPVGCVSP